MFSSISSTKEVAEFFSPILHLGPQFCMNAFCAHSPACLLNSSRTVKPTDAHLESSRGLGCLSNTLQMWRRKLMQHFKVFVIVHSQQPLGCTFPANFRGFDDFGGSQRSVTEVSQSVAEVSNSVAEMSRRCRGVSRRCRDVSRRCRGGVAEVSRRCRGVSRRCRDVSRRCREHVAMCRGGVRVCQRGVKSCQRADMFTYPS